MRNEEMISFKFDLPDSRCEERFLSKRKSLANAINQLECITGVSRDKIDLLDYKVKSRLLSGDFCCMEPKLAEFLKKAYAVVQPNDYVELLKLIGMAHGTRTWRDNAENLLCNRECILADIPATRDEMFMMIRDAMREHGVYDTGFAYDVANKARKGYYFEHGMDDKTAATLKSLGFTDWFASYLLGVRYMSTQAHSVMEFKHTILLTWYKSYFREMHADIINGLADVDKLFQLNS